MTVSVSFDGTVIDTADAVTGWSLVKVTAGGGTPSISLADAAYEGNNNLTTRSDNKKIYVYYDIGSGNELDFTSGGTEEGDLFYIWVNFLPSPLLNTQAGGGLGIYMESGGNTPSSSQYHLWYFEGRDTYTGGWIRLAVDPNKTPSETVGTAFDPSNVRYFGAFAYNNQGTAKYDNFVWDQCAHGKGLIVTGSSTLGLVEELLADEETNRHGVVTALNSSGTAAQILGKLTLGDNVGTVATTITDEDSKLFVAEPLYYETTLKASLPLTAMGIDVVGNATGATSITMGQAVGTDAGRNGITIVGNSTYNFGIDWDDGNVNTNNWYGCSFEGLTGTLSWGTTTTHKIYSSSFTACAQFDPVGGVLQRNNSFVNTAATTGALKWNNSIDISDCTFIANADAIEMVSTTNQDYDALSFSGNTYDTHLNNGGTSINISKSNGSNPTSQRSTGGGTITYVGAATTITLKATETDGTAVSGARAFLRTGAAGSLPYNASVTISNSGTTATVTHTSHGLVSGDKIVNYGCTHNENLGVHTITVTGTNTYTYTTTSLTDTDSGTAYFCYISGTTDVNGEISLSRVFPADQTATGTIRKSTTAPYFKPAPINGTVSSTLNVSLVGVLISDD